MRDSSAELSIVIRIGYNSTLLCSRPPSATGHKKGVGVCTFIYLIVRPSHALKSR
jgi:hypothetical protein